MNLLEYSNQFIHTEFEQDTVKPYNVCFMTIYKIVWRYGHLQLSK